MGRSNFVNLVLGTNASSYRLGQKKVSLCTVGSVHLGELYKAGLIVPATQQVNGNI